MLNSLIAWFCVIGFIVGGFWIGAALEGQVYPYLQREMGLRFPSRR